MIFEKKIINPVIIFKTKIKHMYRGDDVNNGSQGSRSIGLFGKRGCGGRSDGRGSGRGIQYGQGQGGCSGRGQVGYNRNKGKHPHVELSCLPNNIDFKILNLMTINGIMNSRNNRKA